MNHYTFLITVPVNQVLGKVKMNALGFNKSISKLHTYQCGIMKLADMFVFDFRNFCRNGVMKIVILLSLLVSGFWLFSSSKCLSFKHIIKLAY